MSRFVSEGLLGDPGVYVVDARRAWSNWEVLGQDSVVKSLVSGYPSRLRFPESRAAAAAQQDPLRGVAASHRPGVDRARSRDVSGVRLRRCGALLSVRRHRSRPAGQHGVRGAEGTWQARIHPAQAHGPQGGGAGFGVWMMAAAFVAGDWIDHLAVAVPGLAEPQESYLLGHREIRMFLPAIPGVEDGGSPAVRAEELGDLYARSHGGAAEEFTAGVGDVVGTGRECRRVAGPTRHRVGCSARG